MNVMDFGAKGDVKLGFNGSIPKEDLDKLCVHDAAFNANDIGKIISIAKPGDKIPVLKTEIKGLVSSDVVILKSPSSGPAMDLDVMWGTSDTLAVQRAIDKAGKGETIFFPPGIYCAHDLYLKPGISLVSLEGSLMSVGTSDIPENCVPKILLEGAIMTQFIGDNSTFFFSDSNRPNRGKLTGVRFKGLIFDGNIDHNNKSCTLLYLGNVDGHLGVDFFDCEIKNFSYGIHVRGANHSSFEFNGCKFKKNGGTCIAFDNTSTNDIRITDCKFIDCLDGIQIYPNSKLPEGEVELVTWNTCDQVLVERCHFSGKMRNPIKCAGGSFKNPKLKRKPDIRLAATHVTVKGCTVVGPARWWWDYVSKGSADQIALYGVDHFTVTGNVSNKGGDGGIVIQESQHGTIAGNTCCENFGPGIYILSVDRSSSFINVNGNNCIKNCRRATLPVRCGDEGKRIINHPAGIMLSGCNDVLITNNLCYDIALPRTKATQLYGLSISDSTKNVAIGSNIIGSNLLLGVPDSGRGGGGDVFVDSLSTYEVLKSYSEYISKIEVIGD